MMLEPLTLEYLAAGISDRHEVKIVDLRIPGESLTRAISDWKPDIVGITGFTLHVPDMISLSRAVKDISKDIKVIVGGHHATLMPQSFMVVPSIDAIGRGECESIIDPILDGKLSDIPGLLYRSNGEWVENPGEPPPIFPKLTPAHHLIKDYSSYYHLFYIRCVATQIARGCPYSCAFCDAHKFFHGRYQVRDVASLVEEIESSPQKFGFPVDENIGVDSKFLRELADQLSQRGIHKRYSFTIGVREILKNRELLDQWVEIGARAFFIGFERIDDKELAALGKKVTVKMNDEAINYIHSRGGIVVGTFIILPTDTEDYFKRLEEYVWSRQIELPGFTILTPFPGTDIVEEYPVVGDLSKYDVLHAVMPTSLPEAEFYRHFYHLYTKVNTGRLMWKMVRHIGLGKWLFRLPRVYSWTKSMSRLENEIVGRN
jgi:radical SAM superfamily enzyme YgiQ (UPF0313 family)